MKKIYDVVGFESSSPITQVEKIFENKEEYMDYVNSPNTAPLYTVSDSVCENIGESIINGAKNVLVSSIAFGSIFLLFDCAYNGCRGIKFLSRNIKKRKIKKNIKKFLNEEEVTLEDFVKTCEEIQQQELKEIIFTKEELEKLYKKVKG